jgi:putative ABC transport system permease protein
MTLRILKKDISRNKVITSTLFLFILLAAMLVALAVNIIITLLASMDILFTRSRAPHYMQMHSGEINQSEIDDFTRNNPLVKNQQTVTLLGINGANIYLGGREESEAPSIMENSFVIQNKDFDFLLDMESAVIRVNDGEIAVPVYHMKEYSLALGDTVRIVNDSFEREFVITSFARDTQMNPSVVTSKRFVVSENDWELLRQNIGEPEYLIEFLLHDVNDLSEFERMYQASDLPQKDTVITYPLYRLLNALTDGIVAAVMVCISLLFVVIAALCLWLTLTATIEEDYREIGVMKAVGIHSRDILRIYMIKYIVMTASASLLGYVSSFFIGGLFTANISLYMGIAPKTIVNSVLPALGALLVFLAVVLFCRMVLRRFRKISAVEALRNQNRPEGNRRQRARGLRLSRARFKNVNIYLGVMSVKNRFIVYGVLCVVFVICAFLMIVPLNLPHTLESPDFISYMGAGRSDIRIDIFSRQKGNAQSRYEAIERYIENDPDIIRYTTLTTAAYKIQDAGDVYENIKIESGDFSIFPLKYLHGAAPAMENEIALSVMNADELKKTVGDTVTVLAGNEERTLTVCGIYQDVTNGGKTAKGLLPYTSGNILWYVVNIKTASGISIPAKIAKYNNIFSSVKVTDMEDCVAQTLGGLIESLSLASAFAFALALVIAVLITALFFKMLMSKEASQIAIMRGLGLSCRNIRTQYITRAILVLLVGIAAGSMTSVMLGGELAAMLISGISRMRLVINPFMSFMVCPLSLAVVVGVTVFLGSGSIKKINTMFASE